jgi:Flp pilus assembly protein TadG
VHRIGASINDPTTTDVTRLFITATSLLGLVQFYFCCFIVALKSVWGWGRQMKFGSEQLTIFCRNTRGSVAIIFSLSVLALVGIVGLAIDASRAYTVSMRVASMLDAAALAGGKLLQREDATETQIGEAVAAYFNLHASKKLFPGLELKNLHITADRLNSKVGVNVDINMETTFSRVVGVEKFTFNRSSEVVMKMQRIELAMVLDVTGSMNDGGKLATMKTASKDVVDALIAPGREGLVRISLVPYSASVNVGPYANVASGGDSLDGCVMERLFNGSRDTDDATGGSRNYAVNGQLNSSTNPGRYVCPAAVIEPLTNDTAALKAAIDSYSASGWTAGHIGLSWGWNTISPKWTGVFTGARAPGPYDNVDYVKSIILMTDGVFNTAYTQGVSEAEQTAESAARTRAMCTAIKARKINIYAVAYQAPAEAVTLLRDCASSPSQFYDATNASMLTASFSAIVEDLQSLRIKR